MKFWLKDHIVQLNQNLKLRSLTNKSILKNKKKFIQNQAISLMDTPETTRTVNEIIHAGLIEAFSQCENIEPPKMENIKHTQRNKLNSTVGKENNPVLKRVKSWKISCSHPKYKMWNEVGIVERTKAWKAERDKKDRIKAKREIEQRNSKTHIYSTPC